MEDGRPWDGPFYAHGLVALQANYDSVPLAREWLDVAARKLHGFSDGPRRVIESPTTGDGNVWEVGYSYGMMNGGEIAIFLPKKGADGKSQRHCVIYSRGLGGNSLLGHFHLIAVRFTDSIRER